MSVRRWISAGLAVLGALGWTLALPTLASAEFSLVQTFGGLGSGPGKFGEESPSSVASVSSTGVVYVLDNGNKRVERFDPEGKYLSEFTGSEAPAKGFAGAGVGLAVDDSTSTSNGDVYVADTEHNVVDKFDAEGKYISQLTGTPTESFSKPQGVAVDGKGIVYVTEFGSNAVREFDAEGAYLASLEAPDLTMPLGVAVNSSGAVYVVNFFKDVAKLTLDSEGKVESESVVDSHGSAAVAVDSATNDVYVVDSEGGFHVAEYDAAGKEVGQFGASQIGASVGIASGPFNGDVYVADDADNLVDVYSEAKPPVLPKAVTGRAKNVKHTSADLCGTVNPETEEAELAASYQFEYGASTDYGQAAPASPVVLGTGTSAMEVCALVSGLQLEATYDYRLVASNKNGPSYGQAATLTTGTAVEGIMTEAASEIQGESAALHGSLEPNGLDTHGWFEYGLAESEAYGSVTAPQDAGAAEERRPIEATVDELEPNAEYHYRAAGEDALGRDIGSPLTFKTRPVAPAVGAEQAFAIKPEGAAGGQGALVSAEVNPEHSDTILHVAYVDAAHYSPIAEEPYGEGASTLAVDLGPGYGEQPVAQQIVGLLSDTTYHFAVVATDSFGLTTRGPDESFTTGVTAAPTVATGAPSGISQSGATISGTVDPQGSRTTYVFEIGADTSYGVQVFSQIEGGSGAVPVALELHDLLPGTTYHYRLVASNIGGTSYGADETLTTTAYLGSLLVAPLRAVLVPTPPFTPPTATVKRSTTKATTRRKGKRKSEKTRKTRKKGKQAGRAGGPRGTRRRGR